MRPINLAALEAAQRDYDAQIEAADQLAELIEARADRASAQHRRTVAQAQEQVIAAAEAGRWTVEVERAIEAWQEARQQWQDEPLSAQAEDARAAAVELHARRPNFAAIRAQAAEGLRLPERRAELHRFIGQVIEHGWNLVIETPEGVRGIPADQVIQWWIDHGQTVDPLSIAYVERPDQGRD